MLLPFPSKIFALLYILIHGPHPIVCTDVHTMGLKFIQMMASTTQPTVYSMVFFFFEAGGVV